eukprot:TRINITY_DN20900_c0_g1_i1.p1 TRINITY_DN20900_c0_g1~~TRINITY_DN20900_c0_g1_i1.p1  ORF type:complete len:158 (+),score=18.40 TRINITY_DN20900_c0_g1_i1:87-560(+)
MVRIWDLSSGACLWAQKPAWEADASICDLQFSQDGQTIAAQNRFVECTIWSVLTGECCYSAVVMGATHSDGTVVEPYSEWKARTTDRTTCRSATHMTKSVPRQGCGVWQLDNPALDFPVWTTGPRHLITKYTNLAGASGVTESHKKLLLGSRYFDCV